MQTYIALVMVERLKDHEGAKPDLVAVDADNRLEAIEAIASYDPKNPHVQKSTTVRIVMLETLDALRERKQAEVKKPKRRSRHGHK